MNIPNNNGNQRLAYRIASGESVLISANPRAGARSAIERVGPVQQALAAQGYDVQVSTDLAEIAHLAEALHGRGELRAILAAGGDGTASAIRNVAPASAPILPLPFGTECLLARHIGQSSEPSAVCATVASGLTVPLDLGKVNSRLFVMMVSVGVDAEVVHRLQEVRQGHITHAAYVKPTLQALRRYKYPELHVHPTDGSEEGPLSCRWLFGFNLPLYARGLKFAPDADGADGLLDICTFERGRFWNSLSSLWHVSRGIHLQRGLASLNRLAGFRVEAADGAPVAVQVDGDRAGNLPIDVDVVPGGLALMVPAKGARRLGFEIATENCERAV